MQENLLNRTELINFVKSKYNSAVVDDLRIVSVSGFQKEYNSLKESVALRILTENSVIKITGKDTLEFLHRVSTNDLKDLGESEVRNTLFTNEKGRLIDRTTLLNFIDFFVLLGGIGTQSLLMRWINKYIIMEDIKLSDSRNEFVVVEILGPQAESYLTQICGKCIDELPYNKVKNFDMDGLSALIIKQNVDEGINKYLMLLKIEESVKTIDFLINQNNIFDVNLIGEAAYNHFRIEMCWPESPNEINDNFNPYETNLIKEVNFKKGCYIGQEVIARLDTYDKVQKVLCRVESSENIDLDDSDVILKHENNEVGYLTSTSPNSHSTIGLAVIRKAYAQIDNILSANVGDAEIKLKVINAAESE